MYQLLEYNIDYIINYQGPVYLVGTGIDAVQAYKKLLIRSIQLGKLFAFAEVYALTKPSIGAFVCGKEVLDFEQAANPCGLYLVAVERYNDARHAIDHLRKVSVDDLIVTLPCMQFYVDRQQFGKAHTLFENAREKICFVYDHLDDTSKKIWENLLRARYDEKADIVELYQEACVLSDARGTIQYFPINEIFECRDKENVFIDAGALSGSSCVEYAAWTNNCYRKIYTFEPDIRYYELLRSTLTANHINNVEVVNKGVYAYTGTAAFSQEAIGCSKVGSGKHLVDVIAIDDLLLAEGEKVTYIKMDIEGAECQALDGAMQTIKRDHPKLAICIYHSDTDIYEVPYKILHDFGYRNVQIRHYSDSIGESVCYAEWRD